VLSALRRRAFAAVVLVALAAGAVLLVSRGSAQDPGSIVARPSAAGPTVADRAAASPSAGGAVLDPLADGAAPVTTEAPEDVATDKPGPAPDGQASVIISYADWGTASASVEVNAFVGGLVEDGGTCTLELTRGTDSRTVSAAATADASTTICDLLAVPGDQLSTGQWKAVVTYTSTTATGASDAVEVAVP